MCDLNWTDLVREWADSCARLEEITGGPVTLASVPGGYYSRRVACAAAAAGIEILFTSEPTLRADYVDGCMVLGRYSIRHRTSARALAGIVRGSRWALATETTGWILKRAAKAIAGRHYDSIRGFLAREVLAGKLP